MKKILYIHGFNSAGGGHKAVEVQKMFPDCLVVSPTLDYKNPDDAFRKIESTIRMQHINVLMGTSLGGFFAICGSMKHLLPAVIINPTYSPTETLKNHIGKQKNFVTKEEYLFTQSDLNKYENFEKKIFAKLKHNDNLLHFALSTDDELLGDHHHLEEKFPNCKDFNYFDMQGHRFAGVKILRPLIEKALSQSK